MRHEQDNKEVVRKAIEAFNQRDLERFFSFHTDDTTSHEVYFEEPLGRQDFEAFLARFFVAYPDARIDTRNMIAEGDTVVVENVLTGTFIGEFQGIQPTRRSYRSREAVVFELEGGKIKTARIYQDQKSTEQQLGLA